MHGSTPIRSTSLIVKTFASSSLQELPLSVVERADADERELARRRPPAAASRRARNLSPASPSAAASTIPCTLPLGEVVGRVEVAVRVDPDDAAAAPRAFAIPTSEPSATEWSPPSTSGSAPRPAASATSADSRSQRSRIWSR